MSKEKKVGLTTSELTLKQLKRARYRGPRGGSWSLGRTQEEIDMVLGVDQEVPDNVELGGWQD